MKLLQAVGAHPEFRQFMLIILTALRLSAGPGCWGGDSDLDGKKQLDFRHMKEGQVASVRGRAEILGYTFREI